MIRSRMTVAAVAALAAALLATSTAAAAPAGDPGGETSPLEAAIAAYHAAYPKITPEAAEAAAKGQDARKQLYETLTKDGGRSFGGAWFDPPTGVLTVATTSKESATAAAEQGRRLGLTVQPTLVQRSFTELERHADAVRNEKLGEIADQNVGIDVRSNQVQVAVPAERRAELEEEARRLGVALIDDEGIKTEEDAGCTSRNACDWTVRAGSMLWRGNDGNQCSVGFTTRNASGQRFTLTAGHCSSGNGVTWGTAGQSIGPMSVSFDVGSIDAAAISITNSWFTGDIGGEIYHHGASGKSVPVKGVAPTLSYIWSGETVCLAANFTQPSGSNFCGVIGTNSDPNKRGLVRVNGFDACGGDSGGGWYWLTSSGNRIAYGIHSRSSTGCHGSAGGSKSWFTALPVARFWMPFYGQVETR